jgi:hypothetical protein
VSLERRLRDGRPGIELQSSLARPKSGRDFAFLAGDGSKPYLMGIRERAVCRAFLLSLPFVSGLAGHVRGWGIDRADLKPAGGKCRAKSSGVICSGERQRGASGPATTHDA